MPSRFRSLLTCVLLFLSALTFSQEVAPKVLFRLLKSTAAPGETLAGIVRVEFADGMHAYRNPPSEDYMIPLAIGGRNGTELVKVNYSNGVMKPVGGSTMDVAVYEGVISIGVELKAPQKPGPAKVELEVSYQQCDENQCFAPSSVNTSADLIVEAKKLAPVASGTDVGKPLPPKQTAKPVPKEASKSGAQNQGEASAPKPDPEVEKAPPVEVPKPIETSPPTQVTPSEEPAPDPAPAVREPAGIPKDEAGGLTGAVARQFESGNYLFVMLTAVLIGLALTLTPCVYPMIPVTVSYFSNQVGGSRKGKAKLGFIYMLGIALTYGAVGGIFAALGGSIGALFQHRWFLILLAAIMVGLSLSMFGLYEIGIPRFLGKHIHGRSGSIGALIMGVFVGVAAAPCAGPPLVAVASKVAELNNLPLGLLVFTMIGMGLGLPFFALGTFATSAKALPKSGGWLQAFKSVLGIVVLWIGLDYLLKAFPAELPPDGANTLLIKAIFLIASAAYLLLIENSGGSRAANAVKGSAVLICGLLAGQALESRQAPPSESINWVPYSAKAFEDAKRSGKPIVIDASANWCIACHEIEAAVFKPKAGVDAMKGVAALRIDHSTGVDPNYVAETTKQFGIKGLPHIEFLAPGGRRVRVIHGKSELDSPRRLEQYVAEARGVPKG